VKTKAKTKTNKHIYYFVKALYSDRNYLSFVRSVCSVTGGVSLSLKLFSKTQIDPFRLGYQFYPIRRENSTMIIHQLGFHRDPVPILSVFLCVFSPFQFHLIYPASCMSYLFGVPGLKVYFQTHVTEQTLYIAIRGVNWAWQVMAAAIPWFQGETIKSTS